MRMSQGFHMINLGSHPSTFDKRKKMIDFSFQKYLHNVYSEKLS